MQELKAMGPFAVVGAGLIGRAWAIVFARAGGEVRLWDGDRAVLAAAPARIRANLDDLEAQGLIESAVAVAGRIAVSDSLASALDGAAWVQECVAETLEVKTSIFAAMDPLAGPGTVLASSSSAIAASRYTEKLAGRARCLVAHPVNPPYLVPLVELCPAPWTEPGVLARARATMEAAEMVPVSVNREIEGFVLNRLQGAFLAEAFKLVADGVISADDLDRTVKDGLGLRWSFMGPFETIDLNAPGGLIDYCRRYGPFYRRLQDEQAVPRDWDDDLVNRLEAERRRVLPASEHVARENWRDRRLMALIRHKREAARTIGD